MLLASPALASAPAFHLVHFEDLNPSTVPLMAPEAAAMPVSFHLTAPKALGALAPLSLPAMPDEGGGAGVSSDVQPILAILLSAFIGLGLGHLIVHDRDGFILFLVVDIVLLAVGGVLSSPFSPFFWLGYYGISGLLLVVSHVIQVLDVYQKAYGTKLLDRTRDHVLLAAPPPAGPDQLLQTGTTRFLRLAF
jgi:hypothetical protein